MKKMKLEEKMRNHADKGVQDFLKYLRRQIRIVSDKKLEELQEIADYNSDSYLPDKRTADIDIDEVVQCRYYGDESYLHFKRDDRFGSFCRVLWQECPCGNGLCEELIENIFTKDEGKTYFSKNAWEAFQVEIRKVFEFIETHSTNGDDDDDEEAEWYEIKV